MKATFLLFIFPVILCAQLPDSVWSRAYGVDDAHWKCVGMVQTPDGGFAIAGNQVRGLWESSIFWLRLDASADSVAAHTLSWDEVNRCHSIALTSAGTLLLTGLSERAINPSSIARYLNSTVGGEITWERSRDPSVAASAFAAIETPWGDHLVSGTEGNSIGECGVFVERLDSAGQNVQSVLMSAPDHRIECRSLVAMPDSTYMIAGFTTRSSHGLYDFWIRKYTLQGPTGLNNNFGGPASDRCEKIIATSDGGFLLGGTTLSFGAGGQDIWLLKISADGDSLWSQTFGGIYFDDFGSVVETSFGSFLVVGTHEDENDSNLDMLIGSCDANGEHRQQQVIGGTEEDEGIDIVPLDSGVVMFAGNTRSLGGDWRKLWLMRTEYRPQISVDRGSITFGAAQIGDSVVRILNIYNAGGVELIIDMLEFPNGYHANVALPLVLTPAQEFPFEIIFAPQTIGPQIGNLTITSNASTGPVQVRLVGSGIGTAADDPQVALPLRTDITSIYPNPFNAESEIQFSLPTRQHASLKIYNTAGRVVETLLDETLAAGQYTLNFNGRELASGLYIVRLNTPSATAARKLILLR